MPQLDKGFEVFANWQTVTFALGIYLCTYVMRTVVQHLWKNWKQSKLYTDLVLHLFPIVCGGLVALGAKKFPWPMPIADSASARIFYGAILGMFCGVVYGRARAWISGGKDTGSDDVVPAPPAMEETKLKLEITKTEAPKTEAPKTEAKPEEPKPTDTPKD